MSEQLGYDPERVEALHRHTVDAVRHLAAVRSLDPDAAGALRAVRLVRHELERVWLPAITALVTCTALTMGFGGAGEALAAAPQPPSAERIDRSSFDLRDAVGLLDADAPEVWAAHVALLREIAALPSVVLSRLWDDMGDEVRARLLFVHGTALRAIESGQLDDGLRHDANAAIGRLLAARARHHATEVIDLLVSSAATNPWLLDAVVSTARHTPSPVIGAVTAGVLHQVGADRHAPEHLVERADALLGSLATGTPSASLELLRDPEARRVLLTDGRLDPDAVAAAVARGLGEAPDIPHRLEAAAHVLADVIAAADDLTAGARLGVSSSMVTWWPVIDVLLVFRHDEGGHTLLSAVVFDERTDDTTSVTLGTFADFDRLLAELVRDEAAQAALGASVGAYAAQQARDGADRLVPAEHRADVEWNREIMATALADPRDVLATVREAGNRADDLEAFERARALGALTEAVGWASTAAGFVPGGHVVGRIASIGTRVIREGASHVPVGRPRTGHETGMSSVMALAVLLVPLRDRRARRRLGLDEVPNELWDDLQRRTDELAALDPLAPEHAVARNELLGVAARDEQLADLLRRSGP